MGVNIFLYRVGEFYQITPVVPCGSDSIFLSQESNAQRAMYDSGAPNSGIMRLCSEDSRTFHISWLSKW